MIKRKNLVPKDSALLLKSGEQAPGLPRYTFVLSLFACLVMSGCGLVGKRVSAFERSILSKPGMALVENGKERAAMNHMFNAREGSVGGFGGAGGGCGCN